MMYIEELKRDLTGAQLAIWQGTSGLPREKEEAVKDQWRKAAARPLPPGPRGGIAVNASALPARKPCGCGGKTPNPPAAPPPPVPG